MRAGRRATAPRGSEARAIRRPAPRLRRTMSRGAPAVRRPTASGLWHRAQPRRCEDPRRRRWRSSCRRARQRSHDRRARRRVCRRRVAGSPWRSLSARIAARRECRAWRCCAEPCRRLPKVPPTFPPNSPNWRSGPDGPIAMRADRGRGRARRRVIVESRGFRKRMRAVVSHLERRGRGKASANEDDGNATVTRMLPAMRRTGQRRTDVRDHAVPIAARLPAMNFGRRLSDSDTNALCLSVAVRHATAHNMRVSRP